ncbi:hypothetical protein [Actinokineospora sp.]|uniref:hypothetical protein n=1 Tax=Actinokineospora sp. TaxID=1872133 RepID=UPI00403777FE
MDRPTAGRRRMRSGSVHVTELIGRQAPVFDLPPEADAEPTETFAMVDIEPAEHGAHRRPLSRRAQVAKIVGLGVATITLCGAVAAATMISRDRAAVATDPSTRPSLQITGQRALLPHELNPTADDAGPAVPAPRTGAASATVRMTPARTATTPAPAPGTDATTRPARGVDTVVRPTTSSRDLVLEYYRLIESNPGGAFGLLSGETLGVSLVEFLGAWTSVVGVDVLEVVEQPDGVLAVVRMQLVGGTELRIRQLLKVAGTTHRQIVGAELLSAQLN